MTVSDSYLSVSRLKRGAMTNQARATPMTSPTTIQYAEKPTMAPMPVTPSSSQADSPVAWAENAATQ